ncbi:MAG: hypothetical protein ACRBG0_12015 [Lewinella sp.]|uniref:hypothetical protein n=1 Tax=Lewinella sp. TaxID=2004506 RepID=UPI003D6B2EE5
MESTISTYLPEWLQAYDPLLVFGVGIGSLIILIILLVLIVRAVSRSKIKHSGLVVQSFQIAPLGRDAFLKITNPGAGVTLSALVVTGRADVVVKNQVAGQAIPQGGTYSILLEATADQRLRKDFQLHFTFFDQERRTYQQQFSLNPVASVRIKRN